jgi:iron complex transport system substrate-binding protein
MKPRKSVLNGLKRKVDVYIIDCFQHGVQPQVSEFAFRLGVTRFTVSREFKKQEGISLQNYINHSRFARAIQLLQNSNLSRAEVAKYSGFGTERNLDRWFSDTLGRTPSSFRSAREKVLASTLRR